VPIREDEDIAFLALQDIAEWLDYDCTDSYNHECEQYPDKVTEKLRQAQ